MPIASGIEGRICWFPNVVGRTRHSHGVLFDFINRLRLDATRLRILGDGRQEKPYLYVRDLVQAIPSSYLKRTALPLDCFNIGVPGVTTVTRIAEMVVEEMGLNGVKFEYTGGADRGWGGATCRVFAMTRAS